jgi:hypothetical protein
MFTFTKLQKRLLLPMTVRLNVIKLVDFLRAQESDALTHWQ